jgi:hypothetical protein
VQLRVVVALFLLAPGLGCADVAPAPRMLAPERWADSQLAVGYVGPQADRIVLREVGGEWVERDGGGRE